MLFLTKIGLHHLPLLFTHSSLFPVTIPQNPPKLIASFRLTDITNESEVLLDLRDPDTAPLRLSIKISLCL